jgi:radical SAM protein with 4Fe4S-binding SPASM domain
MMEKSSGNGFSVGLGLTNECNLACAHCYRDTGRTDRLSLDDVRRVCENVPVRSVNLGTSENGLHPEFHAILQYLRDRGTTIALTSNGYSAAVLSDDELRFFADLEFSLDFATEREQDSWRGPGNWRLVLDQTARVLRLGVPVTIIAVMMRTNYDKLPEIGALAARHGANFRVNVYQPVKTDAFSLDYQQFWAGFQRLLESFPLAVCNEPIVRAILGFEAVSGGCGKAPSASRRRARCSPAFIGRSGMLAWPNLKNGGAAIVDSPAFRELEQIPQFCRNCRFVESCRGGCPSRRLLRGGLDLPDEFCPFVAGKPLPSFASRAGSSRQFSKAGSACTTVFGAQERGERKG